MKKHLRLPSIDKWPEWVFPLLIFTYVLVVGFLIQLVLLPYLFPNWTHGEGLLIGNDSREFNRVAVALSQKIETEGWQAWKLAPEGQPVAGIAAIFYVLIAPHPWVMLPLNAALHAMAGWILLKIMFFFLGEKSQAILAVLPFVLFPSTLLWVAQIHNDNYAVTGNILLLYAWVCFARYESWQYYKRILGGVLAMIFGGGLIWLVRDYAVNMFTAVGGVLLVSLIILFLSRLVRHRWKWKKVVIAGIITIFSFILVTSLGNLAINEKGITASPRFWTLLLARNNPTGENNPSRQWRELGNDHPADAESQGSNRRQWNYSAWLPAWIDEQMKDLSLRRLSAISSWTDADRRSAGSNVDTGVTFHSALDIVKYIPRAVEIGFLAPFPEDWFGGGSKTPNTMMRRVSGLEMSFIYISWLGLLYSIWIWRKRPEFWVMLVFCTGMLLIYVLGTPNVGSLYRFRYPYIMPMVGLGVAGWIVFLKNMTSIRKFLKFRPRLPKITG